MPQLIAPTVSLHAEWLAAREDWGPGTHEDGFGLSPSDDVHSTIGFAAWVARLLDQADPVRAGAMGRLPCTYRWIVEDGHVVGGIALRRGCDARVQEVGHVGFGIRPSARGRGLATWALRRILDEARMGDLERVLLICEEDNTASARTIERVGGILEGVRETGHGSVQRYWIDL